MSKKQAIRNLSTDVLSGISQEKLKNIRLDIYRAMSAINSVEAELDDVDLRDRLLIPDSEEVTVWTQLYGLQVLVGKAINE
ncbi:MAG: hypothetical protein GY786_00230 [Proteobacteria bacterium]|nr:hypothetical protein [Pseudomonadota bacterium]